MIDLQASIKAIRTAATLDAANDALRAVQEACAQRNCTVAEFCQVHDHWLEVWGAADRERLAKLPVMAYTRGNVAGD